MNTNLIKSPDFIASAGFGQSELHVIVVGVGGTGSALLGKLFQLNSTLQSLGAMPLKVTVYDDDVVTPSNTGRQAFYPFDIGRPKAQVLVERFNQFGGLQWEFKLKKFSARSVTEPRNGAVIFGCVDNANGRKEMHSFCMKSRNCVYIDSGNDSRSGNVVLGMNARTGGKQTVIPTVYDLFRQQLDSWVPVEGDSCSHEDSIRKQDFGLNDMMASQAIQMFWQLIKHGQLHYQGVAVDLETGKTDSFPADPEVWAMFGFECSPQ